MQLASFRVDVSRLPIVTVVYPASPTIDQMRELFETYARLSAQSERLAYVIDFRDFDPTRAPLTLRRAAADFFLAHAEILRRVTLCEARVVTSAVSRSTLTAFDWQTGTKWPCANFASIAEANSWVERRLHEATTGATRTPVASPATVETRRRRPMSFTPRT